MYNNRTAFVLSGGGATGAYEVGIMKALMNGESPVTGHKPPEVGSFVGTSVGAYNASFMAAQEGSEADAVGLRPFLCGHE